MLDIGLGEGASMDMGVRDISGRLTIQPIMRRGPLPDLASRPLFGQSTPEDPKPRLGWRNVKYALGVPLGLAASFSLPATATAAHTWAYYRTVEAQNTPVNSVDDVVLNTVAQVDNALYSQPLSGLVMDLYTMLLLWQGLSVSLAASKRIAKKTLDPKDLYAELHRRGITGQGLKVGVIDSGYRPNGTLPKKDVTFFTPKSPDQVVPPQDPAGHGTAVASLIKRAVPDSQFVILGLYGSESIGLQLNRIPSLADGLAKQADRLTLASLRQHLLGPAINEMAQGVRQLTDQGVQVINISMSINHEIEPLIRLLHKFVKQQIRFQMLGPAGYGKATPEQYKTLEKRLVKFIQEERELASACNLLDPHLRRVFKPWIQALDYAHRNNVLVVLAAGNDGSNRLTLKQDCMGNVSALALTEHPALVVVGSTNEERQVSSFTSEFRDDVTPTIAANGSGELSTEGAAPHRSMTSKILAPFNGFVIKQMYRNPQGTSFSTPDVTSVYLLMKAVYPQMSLKEAREIMIQSATQAHFSPQQLDSLKRMMEEQLGQLSQADVDKEVEKALKRRVGQGTLSGRRLSAIAEAERRGTQRP